MESGALSFLGSFPIQPIILSGALSSFFTSVFHFKCLRIELNLFVSSFWQTAHARFALRQRIKCRRVWVQRRVCIGDKKYVATMIHGCGLLSVQGSGFLRKGYVLAAMPWKDFWDHFHGLRPEYAPLSFNCYFILLNFFRMRFQWSSANSASTSFKNSLSMFSTRSSWVHSRICSPTW